MITNITKRDIIDIFINGIQKVNWIIGDTYTMHYDYNGVLDEVDFLKRIYDLNKIESFDSRYEDAETDIRVHERFGDYYEGWIFDDERFNLKDGPEEVFLNFICEVFHPEVRDENKDWGSILEKISELLKEDGIEIYIKSKISGRNVYSWRFYEKDIGIFIPFTERNKKYIHNKKILLSISKQSRYKINKIFENYNENLYFQDETGYNYTRDITKVVFENLSNYYVPKHYYKEKLIESEDLKSFIENTYPFNIFDAIELFYKDSNNKDEYEASINKIFKLDSINYIMQDGKIHFYSEILSSKNNKNSFSEEGVEKLLIEADDYYRRGEFSTATEKIWDAFERLKTFYYPVIPDKKMSSNKIIEEISVGNGAMRQIFKDEFTQLKDIGNRFRIRHHEKNSIEIYDDRHFSYFYKRCLSLITTIIDFISLNK